MAEAAGENSLDLAQQQTAVRSRICSLESRMLQHPQVSIEVQHLFSEGLYSRRMFVPKGVMWTGKIHRKGHICVLLSGEMTVVSGEMSERLIAPAVFTSRPGVKRAGFAHTDSIFMTVHATTETDLDKIEAELIAPDFTEFDNQRQSL